MLQFRYFYHVWEFYIYSISLIIQSWQNIRTIFMGFNCNAFLKKKKSRIFYLFIYFGGFVEYRVNTNYLWKIMHEKSLKIIRKYLKTEDFVAKNFYKLI